ncbi:MAG: hypothetical protein F6K17_20755 [Okeania sp. SIO3C4]|nr:hypothetical protein [Okeania sp. SIO3C4]
MVCISMGFNLRRLIKMNNNISKEAQQIKKNSNKEQMNAIAKAMIVSFAWSWADLLQENKSKNNNSIGNTAS